MFGALRLVSVEQGYDPRDFALVAFGGAGPLHANALGILLGCWPVIIPPSPGVLCAYGDATTKERNEASRTFIRPFSGTTLAEVTRHAGRTKTIAAATLDAEGVPRADQTVTYQMDVRYHGQGLELPISVELDSFKRRARSSGRPVRRDPQAAVHFRARGREGNRELARHRAGQAAARRKRRNRKG